MAKIAINLPEVAKALMVNLVAFNRMEKVHLTNEIVIAFYEILRKYPNLFTDIKQSFIQNCSSINETESLEAMIWILGTFADQIEDSPYILEEFINGEFENVPGPFEKYPSSLKSVILTQTVQTFVKRPPETINILRTIFKLILNDDGESLLLKDHAAFYYRALRDSPQ